MQPEQPDWQQPSQPPREFHPPAPESSAPRPTPAPSSDEPANLPEANIQTTAPQAAAPQPREGEEELVRWQATEYIHREKNLPWYMVFGVIVIVLILLAIFLLQSITFAILIPVMAAAVVIYSLRPPAVINYTLSRKGLHINDHLHHFEEFKEFGLIRGDDEYSVLLVPRKRFLPGVSVYFPEDAGEAIVDMLAARLPMHEIKLDPIDRLTRFLRI